MFTVGHSTHELEGLVAILRRNGVARIADVRTVPKSRRLPQFNSESLRRELPAQGIDYVHIPELGGFRRPLRDSPNGGWENGSFRGYADHMRTPQFHAGLDDLLALSQSERTAVMCAEALWYRCHRRLISDALVARGVPVWHIGFDGRLQRHSLTEFAVVDGSEVTYPPQQGSLDV